MSAQTAIDFVQRVQEDRALAERVGKVPSGDLERLCDLAKGAGFRFTVEDWKSACTPPVSRTARKSQAPARVARKIPQSSRVQSVGKLSKLRVEVKALPVPLQSFGGGLQDPHSLVMGLDWSIGRLDI